jgi:hypothetical protein
MKEKEHDRNVKCCCQRRKEKIHLRENAETEKAFTRQKYRDHHRASPIVGAAEINRCWKPRASGQFFMWGRGKRLDLTESTSR